MQVDCEEGAPELHALPNEGNLSIHQDKSIVYINGLKEGKLIESGASLALTNHIACKLHYVLS